MLTPSEIAERINMPLERWPGNCFAIAVALIQADVVEGEPRYGAYRGPVSPQCVIPSWHGMRYSTMGSVRHGWIEQSDGTIVDPTRWVFEATDPEIAVFGPRAPEQSEYDVGNQEPLTWMQVFYLANVPPRHLGEHAREIFTAIEQAGERVLIPTDNYDQVMGSWGRWAK